MNNISQLSLYVTKGVAENAFNICNAVLVSRYFGTNVTIVGGILKGFLSSLSEALKKIGLNDVLQKFFNDYICVFLMSFYIMDKIVLKENWGESRKIDKVLFIISICLACHLSLAIYWSFSYGIYYKSEAYDAINREFDKLLKKIQMDINYFFDDIKQNAKKNAGSILYTGYQNRQSYYDKLIGLFKTTEKVEKCFQLLYKYTSENNHANPINAIMANEVFDDENIKSMLETLNNDKIIHGQIEQLSRLNLGQLQKIEVDQLLKISREVIIPTSINITESPSMQNFFEGDNIDWSLNRGFDKGIDFIYDHLLDDKYNSKDLIKGLVKNPQKLFVGLVNHSIIPLRDISKDELGQYFISPMTLDRMEHKLKFAVDMFEYSVNTRVYEYQQEIDKYTHPSQNLIGVSQSEGILYESAALGAIIGFSLIRKTIPLIKKLFRRNEEPSISVINEYIRTIPMKKFSKPYKNKRKTSRKLLKKK